MANAPDYGVPDRDSPELTASDIAGARRWRPGDPDNGSATELAWVWAAGAIQELEASPAKGTVKVGAALKHLGKADRDLEEFEA
jgi:hypothetical protein